MKPIDEFLEAHEQAKKMTPEQRFFAGAELFDYACGISKAGIRSQHPGISDDEVLRILRERLDLGRRLELLK